MFRFQYLLILLLSVSSAYSDILDRVVLEQFDERFKLNQNTVQAIHEDDFGFLWVGTQSGLHYYLGQELLLFQRQINGESGLLDNYIIDIQSAESGKLIVVSMNGLSILDRSRMSFKPLYTINEESPFKKIHSITFSEIDDYLWLHTDIGIYRFTFSDGALLEIKKSMHLSFLNSSAGSDESFYAIIDNQSLYDITKSLNFDFSVKTKEVHGSIYNRTPVLVLNGEIHLFENGGFKYISKHENLVDAQITQVITSIDGRVWISTLGRGIFGYNLATQDWLVINQNNSNLKDDRIYSIGFGSEGILWIGSAIEGLLKYDLNSDHIRFFQPDKLNKSLGNNSVRAIEANDSYYLAGTETGLSVIDRNSLKQEKYYSLGRVLSLVKENEDLFWVGTEKGLFKLEFNHSAIAKLEHIETTKDLYVRTMAIKEQALFFGTNEQGLYKFEPSTGLVTKIDHQENDIKQIILSLLFDKKNRLWVGAIDGLYLVTLDQNESTIKTKETILDRIIVRDINQISNDKYYVASHDGLIKIIEIMDGQFSAAHFTTLTGLSDNTVYSINNENNSTLWISHNKGIDEFSLQHEQVINRHINEATLGQSEFNGLSRLNPKDGNLLFGGVNGLTIIELQEKIDFANGKRAWITSIEYGENLSEKHFFPSEKLILGKDQNAIKINFSTSDFRDLGKQQFRYRVNQKPWVNLPTHQNLLFVGLDAGSYFFEMEFSTTSEDWSPASNQFSFEIKPLFWLSLEAKLIYLLLFVLLLWLVIAQEYYRRKLQNRAISRIKTSEQRLKMAIKASGKGLWDWSSEDNKIYRFNIEHIFGGNENMDEMSDIDYLVHPADLKRLNQSRELFKQEKDRFDIQFRVTTKEGGWRWIHDVGRVVELDEQGELARATGIYSDITEIKRAELESILSNEIIRNMTEAVAVMDSSRKVTFVNPAFSKMTGYNFSEVVNDRLIHMRSSKHSESFYENIWIEFDKNGNWFGEFWMRCKGGKDILCTLEAFHIEDKEIDEYLNVLIFNDITERKKAEEKISYLARYDVLTGLPNRSMFTDRLEHALALANRHGHQLAVMFIDLDGFKKINDSFGHQVGDILLKKTAENINVCIRKEDTLARLSGDEFILLIEEYADIQQLDAVASKILSSLREPQEIGQHQIMITSSIGISQSPTDAQEIGELMKFADTAMYYAKKSGKNQFSYYRADMQEEVLHRINIENHLRSAVSNEEFEVYFQPIINVNERKVGSAEALLRWNSKALGQVFPGDFIPLAEETGMIIDIGYHVFELILKQIQQLDENLGYPISIAFNISVKQLLHDDFNDRLVEIISKFNSNVGRLKVEITESLLMVNSSQTIRSIEALKQSGFTVSVDDFGTGYSSLSYLKRFSIDELKIDKEFISDIQASSKEASIVGAILALGKSLNLKVVAEGVETADQFNYLSDRGCQYVQGFYFCRPCPISEFISNVSRINNELQLGITKL